MILRQKIHRGKVTQSWLLTLKYDSIVCQNISKIWQGKVLLSFGEIENQSICRLHMDDPYSY